MIAHRTFHQFDRAASIEVRQIERRRIRNRRFLRSLRIRLSRIESARNGVGYGSGSRSWTHIDGWSEAVIEYIRELEAVA